MLPTPSRTKRHSTYRSQEVVIEYRWHPLYGKRVPLFRRAPRRGSEVVHVVVPRELSRELPAWMCDAAVCAAMSLGPPQVSITALTELRAVLTARSIELAVGGSLNSSQKKGGSDEATERRITQTTGAVSRTREQTPVTRAHARGNRSGACRSSAGSTRRRRRRTNKPTAGAK